MAVSKKKTTAKSGKAAASASLPATSGVPEGFEKVGGSYAPTWKPEKEGDSITGEVTSLIREVEMKMGRKTNTRRVVELTTDDGVYAVWESATLSNMFAEIDAQGPGATYYIRFDGLGKKKTGQNPPKLFTVAKQM